MTARACFNCEGYLPSKCNNPDSCRFETSPSNLDYCQAWKGYIPKEKKMDEYKDFTSWLKDRAAAFSDEIKDKMVEDGLLVYGTGAPKPKQGYCCDAFRKAVESKSGGIRKTDVEGSSVKPVWVSNVGWFQDHCFSCGKPTKPPIKS